MQSVFLRVEETVEGQAEAAEFVELKLAAAAPEARAEHGEAIEVRLKSGRSLVVVAGFDANHLRALLAVVESGA